MRNKNTGTFPRNALSQAKLTRKGWSALQGDLHVPNLTFDEFSKKVEDAQKKVAMAERLRRERAEAVRVRNEVLKEVWDFTKRIRNATKATFGDNSPQVDLVMRVPARAHKRQAAESENLN